MRELSLLVPRDLASAAGLVADETARRVPKAGGIDLIDRMKEGIEAPEELVDLASLRGLDGIELQEGDLVLGALATLAAVAADPRVRRGWPLLARAAGSAATPLIRNRATVGGNLCQRSRCWYFRNSDFVCLRRGGAACSAETGDNRYHAVLGGGPCHHVHPSTLATALTALDAELVLVDGRARTTLPVAAFFVSPDEDPSVETVLASGQLLESVRVPADRAGWRQAYVAIKEKDSHDWPLVEIAVALRRKGDEVSEARIVLGHAAPTPWRAREAERLLVAGGAGARSRSVAARAVAAESRPLAGNGYKPALLREAARRAMDAAAVGEKGGAA